MQVKRRLTPKEREKLGSIITNHSDINSKKAQQFIKRPHVAVALEAMLDLKGLSDEKLVLRLKSIINRKSETSPKTGISNKTTTDANALNTIRTIWQVKGKFTEKHELKHGSMGDLPEEQLDKIIDSGMEYIRIRKSKMSHGSDTSTPTVR